MRIIAGSARGRRIKAPVGDSVRPTSDRVKEAWFSSIGPRIIDATVLDLYSGSGALGLESASRGAARVISVEDDPLAFEVVEDNIAVSRLDVTAIRADVGRTVGAGGTTPHAALTVTPIDIVVMDPPYRFDPEELGAVLEALVPLLSPNGEVWIEAHRKADIPWPAGLSPERERRYGDTVLHTAKPTEPTEDPS